VAFLKRLVRHQTPNVSELKRQNDVDGLVRALQHEPPEIVMAAAKSIAILHRDENESVRQHAASTGPALLAALVAARGMKQDPLKGTPTLRSLEKRAMSDCVCGLIDALGEIRAQEAGPLLMTLVADPSDVNLRCHAARALGRIPGPGHAEALAPLLGHPEDPATEAAAAGLVALGHAGLPFLREYLLAPAQLAVWWPIGSTRFAPAQALQAEVAAGGRYVWEASAILEELDAAERDYGQRRRKEIETQERAYAAQEEDRKARAAEQAAAVLAAKRAAIEQTYPLEAKLAAMIGGVEWVVGSRTIKPGPDVENYRKAVETCRRLGLRVDEHEKVRSTSPYESVGHADVWADVDFEGESFKIDGGDQMYFGNEW